MESKLQLVGLGLFAAVAVACQAPVMPLSAQQGSSVLIPIGTNVEVESGMIGFGGALKSDPQRGTLVYRLDDPTGTVLPTYATTIIPAAPSSLLGRTGNNNTAAWMVVSLVDVPITAPLGSHALYVTHEVAGTVEQIPYAGTLKILPNSILVSLPGGGTELITGATTRMKGAFAAGQSFVNFGTSGNLVVPDPQILVGSGDSWFYALELELSYPTAIMAVRDVFERAERGRGLTHPASVWFDDDAAAGRLRITAVSASGWRVEPLAVAFTLKGTTRLDPDQVNVTVRLAADWDGNQLSYVPFKWIE